MMFRTATAAALALASTATADPMQGLQGHDIQRAFILEPCAGVIATIDTDTFNPPDGTDVIQHMITMTGEIAMTFGFIMGFEASNPNISGTHETALMRLRADCAADPSKTALHYLNSYAAE